MKNPFRKTPIQQLETTIASLTKRGEQLSAERIMAQDALGNSVKARQHALLSGDLDDHHALDKLQAAVVAATSDLAGIDDALAVLVQHKAEAEHQIAAERERIKRAASADKLAKEVAAIEAALPSYLARSREFVDALSKIGHWHFESGQIAGFIQNTMGQVEVAANFAFAELKAMPIAIREGRQAMPGEPTPEAIAAATESPPALTVFMMRSAHYRNHEGSKRFAGQWTDATMPAATAQRAMDKGIAVPLTDHRRARLRGTRGGDFNPRAPDIVDLDAVEEPKNLPHFDPMLRSANFTPLPTAEPRTILIDVPRS
ncbi:hypothetical protein [Bradyrhizobium diazoefficiens]|uniref:hypothetical protein n=1 Tax=Bradyrhizobium diazoefficiens TaxID=1355477 RepID=UPI001B8CAAFF|nr:hypothetical protein [Bradyrhizobium diazoefficiens]MBR0867489.1 hypothetical protein [Bradyrhizobium diazoefficiens]MBR0891996.1 hypothetical protein [Bradyrhizobium diazoefficiens]MBR0923732.1 hypothetical protein [Bradyrhizobium diazoefficiens]